MRYFFARKALEAARLKKSGRHGMVRRDVDSYNDRFKKDEAWLTVQMVYDTIKYIKNKEETKLRKDASLSMLYMAGGGTIPAELTTIQRGRPSLDSSKR